MATEPIRPRGARRPEDDAIFRAGRRERRLRQELLVRASVSLLLLAFNELVGLGGAGPDSEFRIAAGLGFLLNGPYYLAARAAGSFRAQAYIRMLIDVALLTAGLYGAGGLAAAPYLSVYMVVTVYAGTVLSSLACVIASGAATAGYLGVVFSQQVGWLRPTATDVPANAWSMAIFNLLVINVVSGLTAILARNYRHNRRRLAVLYEDLERAYDGASRLNAEIQRGARLQVLGEVVTGVAHEIGNALQSALLPIDLARRKIGDRAPEALRYLDQIEYGCTTATGIVRNVLHTARQSPEEQHPVSLAELTRRTLELTGYSLRRDGIAIRVDFPPGVPEVVGPPFRLQQVLLNLLTNAQDALRNGRQARSIAIVGRREDDRVVLEVRDTGPGIPPEVLPRMFEPFYTTKSQGTGLGLTISSDIVRGLGGELTARNAPEGGAIFRVSLPMAASPASPAGPRSEAAPTA